MLLMFVFAEGILLFLYVLAKTNARRRDVLEETVEQERAEAGLVELPERQLQGTGD